MRIEDRCLRQISGVFGGTSFDVVRQQLSFPLGLPVRRMLPSRSSFLRPIMIGRWVMEAAELDEMPPGLFPADAGRRCPGAGQCALGPVPALGSGKCCRADGAATDYGPRPAVGDLRTPPDMYFETGSSGFPDELSKIDAGTYGRLVDRCFHATSVGSMPSPLGQVTARCLAHTHAVFSHQQGAGVTVALFCLA